MPKVGVEGPPIGRARKRSLAREFSHVVASAYDWPARNIVVILRENADENVDRGGKLLIDKGRPKHPSPERPSSPDGRT